MAAFQIKSLFLFYYNCSIIFMQIKSKEITDYFQSQLGVKQSEFEETDAKVNSGWRHRPAQ